MMDARPVHLTDRAHLTSCYERICIELQEHKRQSRQDAIANKRESKDRSDDREWAMGVLSRLETNEVVRRSCWPLATR